MYKIIIAIFLLTLFTSCMTESKTSARDGDFEIEFLFEKNGCKMYRFKDGLRYIYWSDCQGKVQSNYNAGGKSSRTERLETITSE